MGLNIMNAEAEKLAAELASLTDESIEIAVTTAVRERLERTRRTRAGRADRLLAIGRDCAAHLRDLYRSADHNEILYDDRGLPH